MDRAPGPAKALPLPVATWSPPPERRMPWEPGWGDLPHPPTCWRVVMAVRCEDRPVRWATVILSDRLATLGFVWPSEEEVARFTREPGSGTLVQSRGGRHGDEVHHTPPRRRASDPD